MKKLLIVFIASLLYYFPLKAQPIIATDFSYTNVGNDYTFYLSSYFSFGAGPGPQIKWVLTEISNDTVFIKAIYDHRGKWPAMGSSSFDSAKYTNSHSGINYFNVSSNYVTVFGFDSTKVDTFWHVHDSTFYIGEVGIKEKIAFREYRIYPNPTVDMISIQCLGTSLGSVKAIVYDLLGRVVQQEELLFNNKETSLNLNLSPANYILELKDEAGNVQRERIVIN